MHKLVPMVGEWKCMVKCNEGGDGVCGKLSGSKDLLSQQTINTLGAAAKACRTRLESALSDILCSCL